MLVSYQHENKIYVFSNENLKVGDPVFPISQGHSDGKKYYHDGFYFDEEFCKRDILHLAAYTGFPREPHVIKNLHYSKDKAYEIHTTHGFGPVEMYFKIISINRLTEKDEMYDRTLLVKVDCSETKNYNG